MPKAKAAKDVRATVRDGDTEWEVSADCPVCGARLRANVEPKTWLDFELYCFRDEIAVPVQIEQ